MSRWRLEGRENHSTGQSGSKQCVSVNDRRDHRHAVNTGSALRRSATRGCVSGGAFVEKLAATRVQGWVRNSSHPWAPHKMMLHNGILPPCRRAQPVTAIRQILYQVEQAVERPWLAEEGVTMCRVRKFRWKWGHGEEPRPLPGSYSHQHRSRLIIINLVPEEALLK